MANRESTPPPAPRKPTPEYLIEDLDGNLIPLGEVKIADIPALLRRRLLNLITGVRAQGWKTPGQIANALNLLGIIPPDGAPRWTAAIVRGELSRRP